METFYLPNFILDDSEHEEAGATGSEGLQHFARTLPAGANPWETTHDASPRPASDRTGTAPAAAAELPPDLAALIHAAPSPRPNPTAVIETEALLLSPSSLDSAALLVGSKPSASVISALIPEAGVTTAPPGFEGVAQLSPRTPQGSRMEGTPLLLTTAAAASELALPAPDPRVTESHIDWGHLVPSMHQDPPSRVDYATVRNDLLQPSPAAVDTAATAAKKPLKPKAKGKLSKGEGVQEKERQAPTPKRAQSKQKSWASVAVTATAQAGQGSFATPLALSTGSKHSASTSTSLASARAGATSPARRQNTKTQARTLTPTSSTAHAGPAAAGGKGTTAGSKSNRSYVRRNRNRSFGSTASDDPWPEDDDWAQESSHAAVTVGIPGSGPQAVGQKSSAKTKKKTAPKLADKQEDDMDDERNSSSTESPSNTGVVGADIAIVTEVKSTTTNQCTTLAYAVIGSVTSLIEVVGNALCTVVTCFWPVVSTFGMVFAFVAKTLIIFALGLANTFRYAAVEVEQSESGSFFCYMVFYVVPNACDFIMSLFSLPQFTPHILSSFSLYCLCHPSAAGSRRKTFRGKASGDPQAEVSCKAILQCFRYSIPFDMLLEGFSQPNMVIMMLDVPSRLLLAYVLSLVRANLILSPVAWVCWSVQVLISVYLPYNKLTECLLLLVGLASVRLCTVIQSIEVVSTKEA